MARPRRFDREFDHNRAKAFIRSKCQADYRGEPWELTLPQYCTFWKTEERWKQRGRHSEDLVLTRKDVEKPWNTTNCVIITRMAHLQAKSARDNGYEYSHFYKDAIKYGK